MVGNPSATSRTGAATQSPNSSDKIETIVSRAVAGFVALFSAQAIPVVIVEWNSANPVVVASVIAIYGGVLALVLATAFCTFVRAANLYVSVAYLVSLAAWPLVVAAPGAVVADRPWLWILCTVATSTASMALSTWQATIYVFLAPVLYGVVRLTSSGGGASWSGTVLDVGYAVILGGAVLILITLLRQAAVAVDIAQAAALSRYSHAVRQHATEVERMQVDAIVHDSVLTTFLTAARAYSVDERALSTRMAINAMGHLRDAAAATPDGDATVSLSGLRTRIRVANSTLSRPFEFRGQPIVGGTMPIHSAEAVYSATVQAVLNSLQHAGKGREVQRWLSVEAGVDGGIRIGVGDSGRGFVPENVSPERIGLRVSIIERVTHAGGGVTIESTIDGGTVIWITWPAAVAS